MARGAAARGVGGLEQPSEAPWVRRGSDGRWKLGSACDRSASLSRYGVTDMLEVLRPPWGAASDEAVTRVPAIFVEPIFMFLRWKRRSDSPLVAVSPPELRWRMVDLARPARRKPTDG